MNIKHLNNMFKKMIFRLLESTISNDYSNITKLINILLNNCGFCVSNIFSHSSLKNMHEK